MKKFALFIAVLAMSVMSYALNPFAYALSSSLSEDGATLTVNYSLNAEATAVSVVLLNGEEVLKTVDCADLGLAKGEYTVEIPTEGLPVGVELTWNVEVQGTSVEAPTEHAVNYSLYHPSSVDVDNNPENPTFGLVLANEAMHTVKNIAGYLSTGYGAGIYAFNAAFEPIANGENPGFNGGNEFVEKNSTGTSYAPRRIRISDDGRIFVTSLDVNGTYLWEVNPANLNEWNPVFQGGTLNDLAELVDAEGNFVAGPNAGFDVRGAGENLQLLMLSGNTKAFAFAPNGFKCAEYNLGTKTTWEGPASRIIWDSIYALVPTQSQVQYDADGGVWFASYRGTTTDAQPGLVHWTKDGVEDFKWLRDNTRNAGIRFNHDFTKMAVASPKQGVIYVMSVDAEGKPVLTEETVISMATVGNNVNDFAWDYAGNLYALGHSAEKIVAWAMPYSGVVATPAAAKYAFQLEEQKPEGVEIPVEITNLSTEVLTVGEDSYLQLMGNNAENNLELQLFLNNYTGEDKEYEVNAENYYLTLGGVEMTLVSGALTQSQHEEFGAVYTGQVKANMQGLLIILNLSMHAMPAVNVEVVDATITIDEESAIFTIAGMWGNVPASLEISGYEEAPYAEYAEAWLSLGDDVNWVDAAAGPVTLVIEDGIATVEGELKSFATGKKYVAVITGVMPIKEPTYDLELPLEITNLTTEVLEVEGQSYLQLMGRDDMNDADVMLFLNNYTGEDKEYEVNIESSYMTFGGLELTITGGALAQSQHAEYGAMYAGRVTASVEEEGMVMHVALDLTMYAAPAEVLVLTDAIVAIDENLGTLTFNVPTEEGGYYAELAGYTAPGVHEGPQICLFETPEVVAFANYVETSVADGVITLTGEFTSFMGAKFDVTISGKLPVEEPVEKPEPVYTENALNTYAFGLESELTEDASVLNVTYRLNNSNATSVNVLVYEGEVVVATIPGGTSIGKNVVEVATAELPQGVELTWGVEVNGTSVEVPTREEKIYSFYHPSGVDIDNNPENATFGMLLVNEGMESVASKTEGYVSAGFGAGIFAFAPSFDLIPNGELPGYKGGVEFTTTRADGTGTAYSPRRIRISEDGRIFVTSLNTDGNYLWEVNPDNLDEWTTIFSGELNENKELVDAEGNFVAAPNNGFDVKGAGENLQLAMYSVNLPGITAAAMSGFRLHEYNLGTATTWATAPSKTIVDGLYAINYTGTQVEYDNEGGVWIASYRGTASDANPGLVHINADGVEDLKLVWSNVRQAGIRFNNDFTKLVVAGNNGAAKKATIYAVSKDENGAPVLTEETVIDMAVVGNNLNDFAWDYAGNLYSCGNSSEKLAAWAMPYSGTVVTPAASQYAFQVGEPVEPVEMVGVVKRTLFNGYDVVVLTHEEDGTAHIYNIVEGDVLEVSQEGVIAVDPENAGDYLAISDIALTEDGKLIATNYMQTQAGDTYVNEGYKRGETRIYMWDDLAGAPSILFTSKMCSNWFRSKQGLTMAVKGTSDNMEIFMTGIHATSAWARVSSYRVIDGVYVDPEVNHNDHYNFYDINDAIALETTVGEQYELNASPLGAMNWVLDAEKINPTEITEPETNNTEIATSVALTEDLGKKYNGASYITVGEAVYMVAPFANPDGELVGIEILNITNGFDAPQYVDMLYLDEAVSAQAAATAVTIVENTLVVALVVDAQYYMFDYELPSTGGEYEVYEDEITNLVIDLDNLVLIGGPSTAFQVDVYLPLGEYNMSDDSYQLTSESSIAVMGSDATFIEGYAYEVDAFTPSAKAVVRCEWNGMKLEFHLTMSAAPMEATVVVVEDAVVEIEKYVIFGDVYDYALKMTGEWVNEADGLTYPVLVEVPVYYPEATEPSEIMSTVTVGGWNDDDPWLGFGEGTLTVTTETLSDGNKLVTATGIVQNPMAGVAIDITISGTITPTGVENATVTVKPIKTIKNGQLIIVKDGVEYNAQGAVIK